MRSIVVRNGIEKSRIIIMISVARSLVIESATNKNKTKIQFIAEFTKLQSGNRKCFKSEACTGKLHTHRLHDAVKNRVCYIFSKGSCRCINVLDKLFGLTLIRGVGAKCTDVYKINSKLHKNREIAIYF